MSKKPKKKTKKVNPINLSFSKTELVHLRDLMSIVLPPEGALTVSKDLARKEGREIQENSLFEKVYYACVENELPVGDDAPDYFVNMNFVPEMEVAILNHPTEVESEEYEDDEESI